MFNIFIGYDRDESAAFHTLCHSLLKFASQPIAITPVNLNNLRDYYFREYDQRQSNAFSFSRFLVPHLMNYNGQAIFMDCDMMVTSDIVEVFDQFKSTPFGVSVVKHDYESKVATKYLGNKQYSYPRKNWSSFIHWNCGHPKNQILTPQFIAHADAATLHRFLWLEDNEIGEIDATWNFLVEEYAQPSEIPKNIHWTLGGPYFQDYHDTDYADAWHESFAEMIYTRQVDKK